MMPEANGTTGPIRGKVLVVDDAEANRFLLREILEMDGHAVLEAADGAEALRAVATECPDLVLLDVNMPGIDGLEVCRRLRADPATVSLPIILVTALADRDHRLNGIAAGANDYLTKPLDRPDLALRVGNALRLRRLHTEIAGQYQRLLELEQMRDGLVHMLVHDLRSPLTGISLYLEVTRDRIAELADVQLTEDVDEIGRCVAQLTDMVSDVLDVNRFEADAMPLNLARVDLHGVVRDAVAVLGRGAHASVVLDFPPAPVPAMVDEALLRRVVANLVGNALKFTPQGVPVRVQAFHCGTGAEIRVIDNGPGIPREHHERIFEKFGQVNGTGAGMVRSSGLGLAFCRLAVESHGGRIGVASEEGRGSTFWIALPAA